MMNGGLPKVVVHTMASIDGRITTARGTFPDWGRLVPGVMEIYYAESDNIAADVLLTGRKTVKVANKRMPKSWPEGERSRKLLVVPDSRGRTRWSDSWRDCPHWKKLIVLVSKKTPKKYLKKLKKKGIEYISAGKDHVDLREALKKLAEKYNVIKVECQGGGELNGVLLREKLVDEISVVVAPLVVGGTAPSLFDGPKLGGLNDVTTLRLREAKHLKNGIMLLKYDVGMRGEPARPEGQVAPSKRA